MKVDSSPFHFIPREGYGIAFDLGTTTLVAQLVNLETGEVIGVETGVNSQSKYGADIISRIEYSLNQHKKNVFTKVIREQFAVIVNRLIRKSL